MEESTSLSGSQDAGTLESVTVPGLLAEAWRDRRTGTLQLTRGKLQCRIFLEEGSPTAVESDLSKDAFASELEAAGLLSAAERSKVEQFSSDGKCPHASAILALRLIDASTLYKAIRKSTRSRLGELFEWASGNFEWTLTDPDESSKGKPHDILSLLQEQLPARWGAERLFQALMPHTELFAELSPRFRRVARKMAETSTASQKAIERINGHASIGQILGEAAGDPMAASTLWVLLHSGIIRQNEKPTGDQGGDETLDFEFEIASKSSPGVDSEKPSIASGQADVLSTKKAAKAEALREEIGDLLGQLASLDHYSALGVGEEAQPSDVKRSYFKAAKRFHPDALARMGLNDLKDDAARVFARIAEAFETLSDPGKKASYDASGSAEPEIDTARLAQAETSFRKGEILVRMGNFEGALAYLSPAVELWPEEPAYQSALGWALYKQPRSNQEQACSHLETAVSQAPEDAVVLFRLGVVLRSLGEAERAEELMAQARKLEPSLDE